MDHQATSSVEALLSDFRVDLSSGQAFLEAASAGSPAILRMFLDDPRVDPTVDDSKAIEIAYRRDTTAALAMLLEDGRASIDVHGREILCSEIENFRIHAMELLLAKVREGRHHIPLEGLWDVARPAWKRAPSRRWFGYTLRQRAPKPDKRIRPLVNHFALEFCRQQLQQHQLQLQHQGGS